MNWYKKANPDIYARVYEELKNKKYYMHGYHGTDSVYYEQIHKNGAILSPQELDSGGRESRSEGLDQVFFTTHPPYAYGYATAAKSKPYR